jgi:ABC-2 type transport system permease protein
MIRILDIAIKDLVQILRDKKVFLFMLIMPVAFTFLFAFAFGGFSKGVADPRLKVALLNEDDGEISPRLVELLGQSDVIAIVQETGQTITDYEKMLEKGKIAGILLIPEDYSATLLAGDLPRLSLTANMTQSAGTTIQAEVLANAYRLTSAVQTALLVGEGASSFSPAFVSTLVEWKTPPVRILTTSPLIELSQEPTPQMESLAQTSPGMILQFAIAGLLTCATVIVSERKTRSLQRLLTTATRRVHILLGHYLAIFTLVLSQFLVLIVFGQLVLHVDYFRIPAATMLVAVTASLCIAGMGLFIGVLAKSEEQAIAFSLIPMFIFAGLGGAWTPLEFTSPAFQAIGHLTPVAWAMDGFKNITLRLLDFRSAVIPSAALAGYALLFFLLAVWRFRKVSE